MTDLRFARNFRLPLEIVTEAMAIVATRGAGKSSAAAVLVEEALPAGVQIVVFDRTGVFWGLRSNASGDGPGLPIYVLGGPHGDVPLEGHAGALIADLVVDSGHSFVLDLSDFSKSVAIRFAADFLERLYDRKARARTTTLVVMDEAHFYAPQTPRGGFKGDSARLMGAMEDMVGLGRSRGLGIVLTTQRTQALNKAVLDMIETLIVMRMLSPRARDAVQDWIREKHEDDREGVIQTLESLPDGTGWVWSPLRGILEKVAIRRIKTFDSFETPKPGQARVEPTARKELDLSALGEQIRATAERVKENDPTELRKRVRELERQLAERPTETQEVVKEVQVEVPAISDEVLAQVGQIAQATTTAQEQIIEAYGELREVMSPLAYNVKLALDQRDRTRPAASPRLQSHVAAKPEQASQTPAPVARSVPEAATDRGASGGASTNGNLPKAARAILSVLAQTPGGQRTKKQLATLTGYTESGGGFNNALSQLRTAGYITRGEPIEVTDAGREAIGDDYEPMPTGEALREFWLAHPSVRKVSPASKILRVLVERWPRSLTKEEIAEHLGYEPSGGGFNNGLSRLRSLELAHGGAGGIKASDDLFAP